MGPSAKSRSEVGRSYAALAKQRAYAAPQCYQVDNAKSSQRSLRQSQVSQAVNQPLSTRGLPARIPLRCKPQLLHSDIVRQCALHTKAVPSLVEVSNSPRCNIMECLAKNGVNSPTGPYAEADGTQTSGTAGRHVVSIPDIDAAGREPNACDTELHAKAIGFSLAHICVPQESPTSQTLSSALDRSQALLQQLSGLDLSVDGNHTDYVCPHATVSHFQSLPGQPSEEDDDPTEELKVLMDMEAKLFKLKMLDKSCGPHALHELESLTSSVSSLSFNFIVDGCWP